MINLIFNIFKSMHVGQLFAPTCTKLQLLQVM